jgi:mannose-1-phosphate guanylyltransferase
VVVFPSDHLVERPARFAEAVRRALFAIDAAPAGVALVGAVADRPASDLGWIVPGAALGHPLARAHAVTRFVEKPVAPLALDLLRAGALWNTLVIAAQGGALAALCARARPGMASAFDGYRRALSAGTGGASTILDALYSRLRPSDLSRDVLQRSEGLAVVTMTDAGWSDCGTPQGLIESLRKSGRLSSARALLLDFLAEPPANSSQTHQSGPELLRGPSATDTF